MKLQASRILCKVLDEHKEILSNCAAKDDGKAIKNYELRIDVFGNLLLGTVILNDEVVEDFNLWFQG